MTSEAFGVTVTAGLEGFSVGRAVGWTVGWTTTGVSFGGTFVAVGMTTAVAVGTGAFVGSGNADVGT